MNSGENNSKKIAIFVSHRIDLKSMVVDNPLYVPVRCGAALDENDKGNAIMGDNTGDTYPRKEFLFANTQYSTGRGKIMMRIITDFVTTEGIFRLWIPLCRAMTTMYEWKTTFRYAPQSYISFSISQRWRRRSHPMTLLSARLSIRQRSPEYVPETV